MRSPVSFVVLLFGAALSACSLDNVGEPTLPASGPSAPPSRMSITSDDGYYTVTELPESSQESFWIGSAPPIPIAAALVCPNPFPPPGHLSAPPISLWVTTAYLNDAPISRKFIFPYPYTYQWRQTKNGNLYCGYSTPPATSTDGDWELYGGRLVVKSLFYKTPSFNGGIITGVRHEDGNARRIACNGQFIFDPSQPCDSPGGPSDPGGGGGWPETCPKVWIIVEINYGDGTGWHELWSGYVDDCD